MSERLGASFGIDVAELKTGLAQANRLIRESQSEFKAAASGMDDWTKSEEGLKARIKSLTDITEIQKTKVNALQQEYNRLIDEGLDPTSAEAVKLRTKINEEQAALNKNEQELQKQTTALENLGDAMEEAGEETEEAGKKFEGFGDIAKNVGKIAAGVVASVGAGIIALGKAAIESYAEFEQLEGGVQTLFGAGGKTLEEYAQSVGKTVDEAKADFEKLSSAEAKVMDDAREAYKTAGMSANEYIDTVTGFSAALIGSLEGDTQKAARLSNMAIVDMSDNANKMGTDIEALKTAYSGFAKGQYNMLDNLKLGYGGTKTEMERLLADATKLSGVKYDLDSYADVVQAIHVIQEEMEIAGTTSREASTTISGSIGMLKGAWTNLLGGIADDNANMDLLINNLVESITTAADNLLPRINIALGGIVNLVQKLAPKIVQLVAQLLPQITGAVSGLIEGIVTVLPTLVNAVLDIVPQLITAVLGTVPSLVDAAFQIVTSVISAVSGMLPDIIAAVIQLVPLLVSALLDAIPQVIDAACELLNGITEAIPVLLEELVAALPQIVQTLITFLTEQLPTILETVVLTLTEMIPALTEAALSFFEAIVDVLPDIVSSLLENLPTVIDAVLNSVTEAIPLLIDAAIEFFLSMLEALPIIMDALLVNLPNVIETITGFLIKSLPLMLNAAIKLLMALIQALPTIINALVQNLPRIINTITSVLMQNLPLIISAAITLFNGIIQAIPTIIGMLATNLPQIISQICSVLLQGIPQLITAGGQILAGLFKGLLNPTAIWNAVKQLFNGIVGGIKSLFGIHSPSKVMADLVGKNLALGIGVGFKDNIGEVNKMIADSMQFGEPSFSVGTGAGGSRGAVVVNQYNNYSQAHSRYELYKSKQQTAAAVRLAIGV